MKVEVYILDDSGKEQKVGYLEYNGEEVLPEPPDDPTLNSMLNHSQVRDAEGEKVDPDDEPQKWLENLYRTYKSPYLSCTRVQP